MVRVSQVLNMSGRDSTASGQSPDMIQAVVYDAHAADPDPERAMFDPVFGAYAGPISARLRRHGRTSASTQQVEL